MEGKKSWIGTYVVDEKTGEGYIELEPIQDSEKATLKALAKPAVH